MGGWFFTILVVLAAGVWLARRLMRDREPREDGVVLRAHVFKVTFRRGEIADVDGRVPRNVLHAFADIAARHDLTGEARGLGGNELRFTSSISEGVQQQLRNAYFAAASVH